MLGAGTTVGVKDTLRDPPTGARVTGQATLRQGTYLYVVVGQQSGSQAFAPGKLHSLHSHGVLPRQS